MNACLCPRSNRSQTNQPHEHAVIDDVGKSGRELLSTYLCIGCYCIRVSRPYFSSYSAGARHPLPFIAAVECCWYDQLPSLKWNRHPVPYPTCPLAPLGYWGNSMSHGDPPSVVGAIRIGSLFVSLLVALGSGSNYVSAYFTPFHGLTTLLSFVRPSQVLECLPYTLKLQTIDGIRDSVRFSTGRSFTSYPHSSQCYY